MKCLNIFKGTYLNKSVHLNKITFSQHTIYECFRRFGEANPRDPRRVCCRVPREKPRQRRIPNSRLRFLRSILSQHQQPHLGRNCCIKLWKYTDFCSRSDQNFVNLKALDLFGNFCCSASKCFHANFECYRACWILPSEGDPQPVHQKVPKFIPVHVHDLLLRLPKRARGRGRPGFIWK